MYCLKPRQAEAQRLHSENVVTLFHYRLGKPVRKMMAGWTKHTGFPVVTVNEVQRLPCAWSTQESNGEYRKTFNRQLFRLGKWLRRHHMTIRGQDEENHDLPLWWPPVFTDPLEPVCTSCEGITPFHSDVPNGLKLPSARKIIQSELVQNSPQGDCWDICFIEFPHKIYITYVFGSCVRRPILRFLIFNLITHLILWYDYSCRWK
jgi:hypothetical protein